MKNRIISLILAFSFLTNIITTSDVSTMLNVGVSANQPGFSESIEQKDHPLPGYIGIYTAADLNKMRTNTNINEKYILMADISVGDWTPLNIDITPPLLNGQILPTIAEFDGNGYTISGLTVNSNNDCVGLFGIINTPNITDAVVIKNLGLVNVNIIGNERVGAIAGWIASGVIIDNCFVSGTVTAKGKYGGGLIGAYQDSADYYTAVKNCANYTTVSGKIAGGIVGQTEADSTVEALHNYGDVTASDSAGGIVGESGGLIKTSHNYGDITAVDNAGGIAGIIKDDEIIGCFNSGGINASDGKAGGIAGYGGGYSG